MQEEVGGVTEGEERQGYMAINSIYTSAGGVLRVRLLLNRVPLEMELDSGAAVSNKKVRQYLFSELSLKLSTLALKTYSGEYLAAVGQADVMFPYGTQQVKLTLLVVEGSCPALFGGD